MRRSLRNNSRNSAVRPLRPRPAPGFDVAPETRAKAKENDHDRPLRLSFPGDAGGARFRAGCRTQGDRADRPDPRAPCVARAAVGLDPLGTLECLPGRTAAPAGGEPGIAPVP